jgi:tRNA pseudouridine55 synthase
MHTPSGFMLVDKPAGMSSFGVVARVRRVLSELASKKVKVGHTGTLDPFATGLMLIVVGDYCKRANEFSKLDKSYEATVRLGEVSTTGDPEGDIEPVAGKQPTKEDIGAALHAFRGAITQRPPMYSAIKIDGQRAYKLAREGKEVEMPERTITVHRLELTHYAYPDLRISCHVSSGTYIRTLAEDIGKALGTGAYTVALRRTSVGKYSLDDAQSLDEVTEGKGVLRTAES